MAFKRQVVGSSNRQAPQLFGQGFPTLPGFITVYATLLMMMAVLLLVTDVRCAKDHGMSLGEVPAECQDSMREALARSNDAIQSALKRIDDKYDRQKDASHIGIIHGYIKKVEAAQLELAALYFDTETMKVYTDAGGKCRVPEQKKEMSTLGYLVAASDKLDPQKQGYCQGIGDHVSGWSTSYASIGCLALSFFGGYLVGKSQAGSLTPESPPTVPKDLPSTILSTTIGKSSSFTVTIVLLLAALVAGAVLYFVLMDKSDTSEDSAQGSGKDVEAGKTAGKDGKTTSAKKGADGGATSAGTTATTPSSTPTTTGTTSNIASAKPKTADTLMKPPLSTKKSPTPGGGAKSTKSAKASGTPSTTPTPK